MARKRKPFIAIELEVFDDVPAMAQAAKMDENDFGWPLLKLWRRCWQQRVSVVSPLVVDGFLPGCSPTAWCDCAGSSATSGSRQPKPRLLNVPMS